MLGIGHSLIFPNGVRKTTSPFRNRRAIETLLAHSMLGPRRPLRVLDIGASFGLDARGTHDILAEHFDVTEYVLGDLFTRILVDDERGLVFSEDGDLLQVRTPMGFVAVHFSYDHPWQRWLNLPKRLLPAILHHHYQIDRSRPLREVPLVHPDLRVDAEGSPFRLLRMNVFEPPRDQTFDFVLCMHLLVERYFDLATRLKGREALITLLRPGGVLVTGALEDYVVVRRDSDGELSTVSSKELAGP